ncbi:hypothetical protein OS493_020551 [Desmophyllum pertusum]|uniref:Uncharacterized protein n=1 Tax=Desmophyllum pertusum TaxID=174260 RepID=A0A9W9YZA7_9CNID|nr:hypothetical protein OS493_020551 [Desmophyllum pertusum]
MFERLLQWKTFDVKTCRSKLAEHYKETAKVPTSVWSKKSLVHIHQIYTRLSLVKEEQTPEGSSQSKLTHYTDVFTANENGAPNRILVQGQTGIGRAPLSRNWLWTGLNLKTRRLKTNREMHWSGPKMMQT